MENVSDVKEPKITVLYEDAGVIVIDKPAGMLVHGDGRTAEPTVVDWLLSHCSTARGVGEPARAQDGTPLERSGVVHRLDKDTSGVLVLAKTPEAFLHLKAQFHDRLVVKEYRAFVYGTMKEKWGTVNRAIGRSGKDFRLRSSERGAKGILRPSVTDWECLAQNGTHAYLKVLPKTGRTHQIRVHMKYIGHPIVADVLYASPTYQKKETLGFERLALHAHALTITLPSGERKTFSAVLPPDFKVAEKLIASE